MIQRLIIILLFLPWQVPAEQSEITGCAALSQDEKAATKIALIRAKAYWVEHHYGRVVSGSESLLIVDSTARHTQIIKVQSTGIVPPQTRIRFQSNEHIKDIDGKPHLCITLLIEK